MAVKICHASIDENGKARGGAAGDQTGREVKVSNWYANSWNFVLRPKDSSLAERIAVIAEKLANSNLVGYDQNQRNTLHTELKKCGYDVDKYLKSGVKTETDCSAFMTVVCIAGGVTKLEYTNNAPVCSTMKNVFGNTGKFDILSDSKYTGSDEYLKRGDILVKSSAHTVMAVTNGSKIGSNSTPITEKTKKGYESAVGKDSSIAGTYIASANLNLRRGAGTDKEVIILIPKGTRVRNFGYFSPDSNGVRWYLIQTTIKGKTYTGYSSSQFLLNA